MSLSVRVATGVRWFCVNPRWVPRRTSQRAIRQARQLGLLCRDSAAPAIQKDRISSFIADGAFLLGTATLGTGVVLWFLDAPVAVRPGPNMLIIEGQF